MVNALEYRPLAGPENPQEPHLLLKKLPPLPEVDAEGSELGRLLSGTYAYRQPASGKEVDRG
jgi:hypothetical protein